MSRDKGYSLNCASYDCQMIIQIYLNTKRIPKPIASPIVKNRKIYWKRQYRDDERGPASQPINSHSQNSSGADRTASRMVLPQQIDVNE
jgi:hypothetical protein